MTIANTDMEAYAQRQTRRVGTRIETLINESINEAVRRVCQDVPSNRYERAGTLSLVADYSTGTIAIIQSMKDKHQAERSVMHLRIHELSQELSRYVNNQA